MGIGVDLVNILDGSLLGRNLSPAAESLVAAFAGHLQGAGRPRRMLDLAGVLRQRGMRGDAAKLCLCALREAPRDPEVVAQARALLARGVPSWHIPLLHDRERAEAYDCAIRRAVRPGMLVLDVGTGSGLLAMMAARAGAELVVACEQDPVLAQIAEENIRRNGLADRVRVVVKYSDDLAVGVDLPRRADLVVSEIVTNQLLGEDALEIMRPIRERLLVDSAPAIPAQGAIGVALVAGSLGACSPVAEVVGLDVSAMNLVGGAVHTVGGPGDIELLSDSVTLLTVDLSGRLTTPKPPVERWLTARRDGTCIGLFQFMKLILDEDTILSSEHFRDHAAWAPVLRVGGPRNLRAGERVRVHGRHTLRSLMVWADL